MPVRSLLRWLPLLHLLSACGGEVKEEQPNTNPPPAVGTPNDKPPEPLPAPPVRPPQINGATFEPAKPTAQDEIKVKVEAVDPDSNYVELSYLWLINGRQNPAPPASRSSSPPNPAPKPNCAPPSPNWPAPT